MISLLQKEIPASPAASCPSQTIASASPPGPSSAGSPWRAAWTAARGRPRKSLSRCYTRHSEIPTPLDYRGRKNYCELAYYVQEIIATCCRR